ncbi:NAD(P)-dependent oxidoreductase [Candidatus Woesearchaeota archaeon]|nr:NAD(P)-dependent oxidoreductase [Candidatus Woesearchaeota archaeon]
MPKRVLISGINGFIGKNLAKFLVKKGYEVYGFDKKISKIKGAHTVKGDLLDSVFLKKMCNKVNHVIHLAAISFIPDAEKHEKIVYQINVIGTKKIIEAFEKSNAKQLIFASSAKVYGKARYLPIDENHPTKPVCEYGRQKLMCEKFIEKTAKKSKKQYIILRQFNIFGPGQNENFLIPSIISQLKRHNILKQGNVDVKRDYLYIYDLMDAYKILLSVKIKKNIEILNIGSGKSYSVKHIDKEVCRIKGIKCSYMTDMKKVRKEEKDQRASIRKIRKYGWKPKTSLERGLGKIIK